MISVGQVSEEGKSSAQETSALLAQRLDELEKQLRNSSDLEAVEVQRRAATIGVTTRSIKQLVDQIGLQKSLVDQATVAYRRVSALAVKGYVTNSYLDSLLESKITREQKLSELQASLAEERGKLADARLSDLTGKLGLKARHGEIRNEINDLRQKGVSTRFDDRYALYFTRSGKVGSLRYKAGDFVDAKGPLLEVVPDGLFQVSLKIPVSSIAAVRTGQRVRVTLASLPSQSFGVLVGRISTVSTTTGMGTETVASQQGASGYYTATAEIDARRTPSRLQKELRPDMTGSASITVGRLTAVGWFLEGLQRARL